MNRQKDKLLGSIMEGLISEGPEIFKEVLERLFNEALEAFRNRTLEDEYPFVYFDALYEKVRYGGTIRDMAVLVAIGVNQRTGKREILGIEALLSEAEVQESVS